MNEADILFNLELKQTKKQIKENDARRQDEMARLGYCITERNYNCNDICCNYIIGKEQ